jgi:NAD(P)-dependent dehydrogenase (short-subunit alcohol dehydrogenase family)
MQMILITGGSSGFGLETARSFLERGWKVIATMRTPRENVLPRRAFAKRRCTPQAKRHSTHSPNRSRWNSSPSTCG